MRSFRHRQWYLDEVFVKINGVKHDLWRAVDYEGEVLESFVTKRRDKNEVDRQNMNIGHGLLLDRATMALDGIIRCRPEGASTPSVHIRPAPEAPRLHRRWGRQPPQLAPPRHVVI
jgi:hypothetical protein